MNIINLRYLKNLIKYIYFFTNLFTQITLQPTYHMISTIYLLEYKFLMFIIIVNYLHILQRIELLDKQHFGSNFALFPMMILYDLRK